MSSMLIHLFLFLLPFQTGSTVEWLSPTEHDFGDLKANAPAVVEFRFKNTSDEPFTIDNVRSSCGCTASEWEESVILPGGESHIKISYDTKKPGFFYKKITVYFSSQRKAEKLYITGYVE